ncbi:phosphomevalonate kinase [Bacillus rossius redtenbacheri]|uniref:phosphomevalonate kinase n=1 Tax=Bacillus rossius redtenbacheri TaxID=93214 RepID=UPI002FDE2D1F
MQNYPKNVLLISGKRKSGKDFISEKIVNRLGADKTLIVRISAPIKSHWSKLHSLDFDKLSGTDEYKEKYRKDMIQWGEQIRREDYGYFCKAAIDMFGAMQKQIWIVSDIRRQTDIRWFMENFGAVVKTLRLRAGQDVRKQRGFIFTPGVDDVESECGLDHFNNWDWEFQNNGSDDAEKICMAVEGWIYSEN